MDAKSLRIGNIVESPFTGKPTTFREVDFGFFQRGENFQPIPIAEEWLEALGFENTGLYFSIMLIAKSQRIEICRHKNSDESWLVYLSNDDMEDFPDVPTIFLKDLRYIHELQNLYFALTGHELVPE